MKTACLVLGGLLVIVGGVWIGQGAGFIGGGFMTGQPTWLFVGTVTASLGVALLWWATIRSRRFP